MRKIPITAVTPSLSAAPSTVTISVGSDYAALFHGKEWIDANGTRYPFYAYTSSTALSAGCTSLVATTFDIIGNSSFNGRYTVYTKISSSDFDSVTYNSASSELTIRISETLFTSGNSTGGFITNISTYLISVAGEGNVTVLENQEYADRPVALCGKYTSSWGEALQQNLVSMTQHWAGPTPPPNPMLGQLWFDTTTAVLKIRTFSSWEAVNASITGSSFRFTQSTASLSWTVQHNLNLPIPYIPSCDFYANTIDGVKSIIPSDVTYQDANTIIVTFSNPTSGYALIRS